MASRSISLLVWHKALLGSIDSSVHMSAYTSCWYWIAVSSFQVCWAIRFAYFSASVAEGLGYRYSILFTWLTVLNT